MLASRASLAFRRLCGTAALAASLAAAPVAAHNITETLSQAYNHSGLLEQNRAVLRAADEGVAQAMSALRPTVSYALATAYTGGPGAVVEGLNTTFSITGQVTLYDFGRNALGVEVQKEAVLASRQLLVAVEQNVLLTAAFAFFDVLEATEFVNLAESNVRLITQELRAAEDRFEVGEVTRTDVALAQARLASSRSNLANARGDLVQAQAAYKNATGIAAHPLTQPSRLPAIPDSPDAAKAVARRNHPDILRVRHQITANELNLERSKRALRPSLDAQATTSFDLDSGDNSARQNQLSLSLNGPISQGGRLNSLIRQSQAELDETRASLHVTRHDIDQDVENAYAQLAVARANRQASEEQIRASTVAFRGVREEASLGARTTLDVLDAEQELLDARANRVSAVATEFRAVYAVLSSIGRLTAKDLRLPVQLYDPAEYYNLVKDAPQTTLSEQGAALERVIKGLLKD